MSQTIKEAYEQAMAELTERMKKHLIEEIFLPFFKRFPGLTDTIHWDQYTDYFCDGEPCHFYPRLYDLFYDDEDGLGWEEREEKFGEAESWITEQMEDIPYDLYLNAFGDHKRITVKLEKEDKVSITVEDYYEHD